MIETNKQREKRLKTEAPLRAKRATDYALKMGAGLPDKANVPAITTVSALEESPSGMPAIHVASTIEADGTESKRSVTSYGVCPHCGGAI